MDSFAPAVGANTAILPLLNGMGIMDLLGGAVRRAAVLGGQCVISATLDAEGRILHLNDSHVLSFGEQNGAKSPRVAGNRGDFSGAKFDSQLSVPRSSKKCGRNGRSSRPTAGITCLMRGAFGDIVAAGAGNTPARLFDGVLRDCGSAWLPASGEQSSAASRMFTAPDSHDLPPRCCATSSAAHAIESRPHRRRSVAPWRRPPGDYPLLQIAYAHLKAYEARRQREKARHGSRIAGTFSAPIIIPRLVAHGGRHYGQGHSIILSSTTTAGPIRSTAYSPKHFHRTTAARKAAQRAAARAARAG